RWRESRPPAARLMDSGEPHWSPAHLCVPLRARGRVLGALTLVVDDGRRHYDLRDLTTAEDLAPRLAMTIDSAHLCEVTEQSLRARDEFLGLVAHELKTPMTPLLLQVRSLH